MSSVTSVSKPVKQIQAGDSLLLWFEDETTYFITVQPPRTLSIHCGRPIPHADLVGRTFGSWIETSSNLRALLLEPTIEDLIMKARRQSGIIYPKDAAILMMHCGIRSGRRVIEVGVGSGSMTTALAAQVAPDGAVYGYEVREDFLKLAEANLKKAKLSACVKLIRREGTQPFAEKNVDAIVLDVPEPWQEVDNLRQSLAPGGRVASLNPTYNQIERMSGELTRAGFVMIEAQEVLVRGILARPGKTRPEQRMVSHTEFMLFALKAED